MIRPRYGGLKHIKRQIAAGDLVNAEAALLSRHESLLATLKSCEVSSDDEAQIKYRLTLVETLLGVVASMCERHDDADDWFERAHEHFTAFDPIARERMNREVATHLARKGQVREAIEMLDHTERSLLNILKLNQSTLPDERIELEHAITLSCKADAMLRVHPVPREAYQELVEAQRTLRKGNKRLYELDNLMRLVAHTSLFDRRRASYIARAMYINETVARNPAIRLALIDAACGPIPFRRFVQRS